MMVSAIVAIPPMPEVEPEPLLNMPKGALAPPRPGINPPSAPKGLPAPRSFVSVGLKPLKNDPAPGDDAPGEGDVPASWPILRLMFISGNTTGSTTQVQVYVDSFSSSQHVPSPFCSVH